MTPIRRPCLAPRCPNWATKAGRGRCDVHSLRHDYGTAWDRLSQSVRRAADYRCSRCHERHTEPYGLTVDHIRPRRWGGTDDPANLRVLCRSCHAQVGDKGFHLRGLRT